MRKFLSSLLAASIILTSAPGSVFAFGRAVSVPRAVSSPVLGGNALVRVGALKTAGSLAMTAPSLGGSGVVIPATVLPTPAAISAAVVAAPKTSISVSRAVSKVSPVSKSPRKSEGVRTHLSQLEETLSARPASASAVESKLDLDAAFTGSVSLRSKTSMVRGRLTSRLPTFVNAAQQPMRLDPAVESMVADKKGDGPQGPKQKTKLPRSFYLYLGGQFLYGIGQEAAALIAPLYAYSAIGLEFAVLAQAAMLIAIIPGSILGSRLVRKFDSKKVYLIGNLIHAAFFLSVPVVHFLTGTFSPYHFLAFQIVGGLIYGSLRGVAEKEITPRIIGQGNKSQLKKAGSLFYAAFESAELLTAISFGFMIAAFGLNWTSGIMAAIMLASVVPLFFMRLRQKSLTKDSGEGGGTEKKLPWKMYVPFVFAIFVHMSMYDFIAPFLALEVFHSEALASQLIAAYTLGSLAVALLTSYWPKVAGKLSEKKWSVLGVVSTIGFLWGSLLLQMPWVSLGLAGVLGAGLTGMMIQWRTIYQQRLSLDVQPKVFERLMIASVLMTLIPFAVMQGGLLIAGSSAMVTLLTIVSAGITAGAVFYPFLGGLLDRFRRLKNRS
ncbi:MAG: hypothetical protein COB53_08985 [Elusimicrobia bacterium]|nr:MAG: hypothetical protein COB53_08985 [Elusimicrobiota bacterium]